MTRWALAQLVQGITELPKPLLRILEKFGEGKLQPTNKEILMVLAESMSDIETRMFIVLDALDKCSN